MLSFPDHLLRYLQAMIRIVFPVEKPRLRVEAGMEQIFCPVRKKWLKVTPEEWVRQNMIIYLEKVLGYPLSLISVEKTIPVGELKKRFDVVLFNQDHIPFLLMECKEMKVPLSDAVLQQALSYNTYLKAAVVVVTNGVHCAAVKHEHGQPVWLNELPANTRGTIR